MSALKTLVTSLTAVMLFAGAAQALTITNRDAGEVKFTITKDGDPAEHSLAAGASLEESCDEGCVLRMSGSEDEYPAKTGDEVAIKGGGFERVQN